MFRLFRPHPVDPSAGSPTGTADGGEGKEQTVVYDEQVADTYKVAEQPSTFPSLVHVRTAAEERRSVTRRHTPPIDNFLIDQTVPVVDGAVSMGVTPNVVSIMGGLLGIAALVALWFDYLVLFVLLFAASYFTDVVDGWIARTYNMKSKAGEILDHGKDILISVCLLLIVLYKYSTGMPIVITVLLLGFYFVSVIAEGCTQRANATDADENMISGMARLCPASADAEWTRHFATPTFLLVTGLTILGLCVYRRGRVSGAVWS